MLELIIKNYNARTASLKRFPFSTNHDHSEKLGDPQESNAIDQGAVC